MTAALSALVVEIAIIARCCHTDVASLQYFLHLLRLPCRVVLWFGNANAPRLTLFIYALSHHFAAYVHKVVFAAFVGQQSGNHIACLPFGYRTCVQHSTRVVFDDMVRCEVYFVKPYQRQKAVYLFLRNLLTVLKTKPPQVDQRCHCNIKRPVALLIYPRSLLPHLLKIDISDGVSVLIDMADNRIGIEHTERVVKCLKGRQNIALQVIAGFVLHIIISTKYFAPVGKVFGFLAPHWHNQQQYYCGNDAQRRRYGTFLIHTN